MIPFLDTNVIIAYCQDPHIELYGKEVDEFFGEIKEKSVPLYISSSVEEEFNDLRKSRYHRLLELLRKIKEETIEQQISATSLSILESIMTKLRKEIDARNLLHLLELRIYRAIKEGKITNISALESFLEYLISVTSGIFTDFVRKYDLVSLLAHSEKLGPSEEKINSFVCFSIGKKDCEHLASILEYGNSHQCTTIFITIEHELLKKKDEINKEFNSIQITSPLYLIPKLMREQTAPSV